MSIVDDILFVMAGSNDLNVKEEAIANTAKTVAYGAISFVAGYGVTGLLAGRTIVKVGILLALGTNPLTVAIAALIGTIAYRVFKSIIERGGIEGAGSYIASLMMGAYWLYQFHPTNLTETLVIGTTAYLANYIFFALFAIRKDDKEWGPSRFQAMVNAIRRISFMENIGLDIKHEKKYRKVVDTDSTAVDVYNDEELSTEYEGSKNKNGTNSVSNNISSLVENIK